MSDQQNKSNFWRNIAAGAGVVAAGAALAYLLYEAFENESEEQGRRDQSQHCYSSPRSRRRRSNPDISYNPSALRETLSNRLNSGTYECPICLEELLRTSKVFSCKKCYVIYHIECLRHHLNYKSEQGLSMKCPTCRADMERNISYRCFCGKKINPRPLDGETPHSCGEICYGNEGTCMSICHPGPCDTVF